MSAQISLVHGSNLYRFCVGGKELISYDYELLQAGDWTGIPVLFPYPNRVRGKRLIFEGKKIDLTDRTRLRGNYPLIHGIVDDMPWQVEKIAATEDGAIATTYVDISPLSPVFRFFPFPSRLGLEFRLSTDGIRITYTVENRGERNLPYGFALHPYFSLLESGLNTLVKVSSHWVYETDEELLPSGHLLSTDNLGIDLWEPTAIHGLMLDHVFAGITGNLTLYWPEEQLKLYLSSSEDFSHAVLYTLEAENGNFICLENQTSSTDAHNLYDQAHREDDEDLEQQVNLQIVPPGGFGTGWIEYQPVWL